MRDAAQIRAERDASCLAPVGTTGATRWTVHLSVWLENRVERAADLYARALQYNPASNLRNMIEVKLRDLSE
jgi:hypothetical protein